MVNFEHTDLVTIECIKELTKLYNLVEICTKSVISWTKIWSKIGYIEMGCINFACIRLCTIFMYVVFFIISFFFFFFLEKFNLIALLHRSMDNWHRNAPLIMLIICQTRYEHKWWLWYITVVLILSLNQMLRLMMIVASLAWGCDIDHVTNPDLHIGVECATVWVWFKNMLWSQHERYSWIL